jgi:hypothetical protein
MLAVSMGELFMPVLAPTMPSVCHLRFCKVTQSRCQSTWLAGPDGRELGRQEGLRAGGTLALFAGSGPLPDEGGVLCDMKCSVG